MPRLRDVRNTDREDGASVRRVVSSSSRTGKHVKAFDISGVFSAYLLLEGVLYVRFHVQYQYSETRTMVTTATVLCAAKALHSASLDV
jgi:hypothetical protein